MGNAITRYIKKHYRRITVRKEVYERIKRIAEQNSMPMTDAVKMLVEFYEEYGRKVAVENGLRA